MLQLLRFCLDLGGKHVAHERDNNGRDHVHGLAGLRCHPCQAGAPNSSDDDRGPVDADLRGLRHGFGASKGEGAADFIQDPGRENAYKSAGR